MAPENYYEVYWVTGTEVQADLAVDAAKQVLGALKLTKAAPEDATFYVVDRQGHEVVVDLNEEPQ